jgi:hypothetical protein
MLVALRFVSGFSQSNVAIAQAGGGDGYDSLEVADDFGRQAARNPGS